MVESPDRPHGGILERFRGVSVPALGLAFDGATPNSGSEGPSTVDVSRQYDGYSDFPTYPLNLLATANAIAGIYYLLGAMQSDVTAAQPDDGQGQWVDVPPGRHRHQHGVPLGATSELP